MKKTRSHNLEEISQNQLQKIAIERNWIYREKNKDYGIDGEFQFVDSDNNVTERIVLIQLKATDNPVRNDIAKKAINVKNLLSYEKQWLPVFIMFWINPMQKFYYVFVQKYIREVLEQKIPDWRNKKSITISEFESLINPDDLNTLALEGQLYIIKNKMGIADEEAVFYWDKGILSSDKQIVKEIAVEIITMAKKRKFKEARELIRKTRLKYNLSTKENISLYTYEGVIHSELSEYKEAIEVHKEILEIIQEKASEELLEIKVITFGNIGIAYRLTGEIKKAEEYFLKVLENHEHVDKLFLANAQNNLAVLYKNTGQYKNSLKLYLLALDTYKILDSKFNIGIVLGNIGVLYRRLKNYEAAIEYADMSIEISLEIGDRYNISNQYGNKALIFNELEFYDEAISWYEITLKLKEEIQDKKGVYLCYGNIGKAKMNKGQYSIAEKEIMKSISGFNEIGYRQGAGEMSVNLALIKAGLGKKQEAITLLKQVIKLAIDLNHELLKRYAETELQNLSG
ncbi:tetratricopeptide repeat protein [Paenibacillus sp. FSL W7-1332]|uniref:tetratricopeptide repeat protein n=1 Tax=Paenibacillus sp. FSL W7-1332 TaxID=2921702 RepID=UPI0030CF8623